MAKSRLMRRGNIRVAALLSLSGLVIAACSAGSTGSDDPAPVYMMSQMGQPSPVVRQSAAAAPVEREAMEPIALAPSLTASTSGGPHASDVIPLDDPPAPSSAAGKPALHRALMAANPAPMSARFMPPPEPMSEPAPAPIAASTALPTLAPAPAPASTSASAPMPVPASAPPTASPPAAAPPITTASLPSPAPMTPVRPDPSAVAEARTGAAPPAPAAEPVIADLASSGPIITVRDERAARSRPRYYYSP